jgi:hypothetical protein
MEKCPNCERPMRLISRRKRYRDPCPHCGRGYAAGEEIEVTHWRCDHCRSTVIPLEDLKRIRDLDAFGLQN